MARMTQAELAQFAEDSLPPAGQPILYSEWAEQIKASEQPEAVKFYRYLKHAGKVRANLSVGDDGKIVHTIERV